MQQKSWTWGGLGSCVVHTLDSDEYCGYGSVISSPLSKDRIYENQKAKGPMIKTPSKVSMLHFVGLRPVSFANLPILTI